MPGRGRLDPEGYRPLTTADATRIEAYICRHDLTPAEFGRLAGLRNEHSVSKLLLKIFTFGEAWIRRDRADLIEKQIAREPDPQTQEEPDDENRTD